MTIDFDLNTLEKNVFREFTAWVPWEKRDGGKRRPGHPVDPYGGVYLLAHFDGAAPEGPADYLDPGVIYVGETDGFRRSWLLFDASAFHGKGGHTGGNSYRGEFGAQRPAPALFVAALPVLLDSHARSSSNQRTKGYRLYVKQRIIAEITAQRMGKQGLLNKRSPVLTARPLQERWARTRGHLIRAAALLPEGLAESDEDGRLERYLGWIENNELELALDELEGLGGINLSPLQFWVHLRNAAIEMQLPEHRLRLERTLRARAG